MDIILFALIGSATGFLAARTVRDRGNDLVGDMTMGAFCAVIAGQMFRASNMTLFRDAVMDGLLVTGMTLAVLLLMSMLARSNLSYRKLRSYA